MIVTLMGGFLVKNVAVLYKSKYGSTERYAQWIAEAVKADCFGVDSIVIDAVTEYDTLVYCGGIYAGRLLGFSLIRKNYNRLKNQKLIVVAVGVTSKKETAVNEIRDRNFHPAMAAVPLFLLRGGLNYPKMSLIDKTIMFFLVKYLKFRKLDQIDDDAKGLVTTFGKSVDFMNKQEIVPVIQAIKTGE